MSAPLNITVVGDTLLDVDMEGRADRLSPDAPVPVVDVETTLRRAGGAGLVASMLSRDGHNVRLVTALGDDRPAQLLRECLSGIELVDGPSGVPTPVKTRIRAGTHPIVRIDEGCGQAAPPTVTADMLNAVAVADVLVVADYGRGLTADRRLRAALEERGRTVPLIWDPHPKGAEPVGTTAVATPNLGEAARAAELDGADVSVAARAAALLGERWSCAAVAVTLGSHGALLHSADERGRFGVPLMVPTARVASEDPCGAGDRFSATLAVELARGTELPDAVSTAVAEAAAYLAAGGVGALNAPRAPRLLGGSSAALQVAEETRQGGGTVVATGGCFDLLHAGHIRTLSSARALGDCLIVCLNSDESVRRLKGAARPIVGQQDRADLLLALECVDAVMLFDEDTPESALRRLHPDLWVKGGDYTAAELPETSLLESWGGRVLTVPFHPGRSTTRLAAALERVG